MAIHIRRREFIFTLGGAAARGRSRRVRSGRCQLWLSLTLDHLKLGATVLLPSVRG